MVAGVCGGGCVVVEGVWWWRAWCSYLHILCNGGGEIFLVDLLSNVGGDKVLLESEHKEVQLLHCGGQVNGLLLEGSGGGEVFPG